ncbi:3-hydroxyacyl-CoA dehydrogenase, partial [bacterium LRH843]|nr:3-hydroxyacyl-CoA dehydrogenase [bacterium LRH843]
EFTLTKHDDGVAILTWDVPGKSMNVMSFDGLQQLNECIDDALADEAVKGIVITSGKEGSFAGGMDLNLLARMKTVAGDDPARG